MDGAGRPALLKDTFQSLKDHYIHDGFFQIHLWNTAHLLFWGLFCFGLKKEQIQMVQSNANLLHLKGAFYRCSDSVYPESGNKSSGRTIKCKTKSVLPGPKAYCWMVKDEMEKKDEEAERRQKIKQYCKNSCKISLFTLALFCLYSWVLNVH